MPDNSAEKATLLKALRPLCLELHQFCLAEQRRALTDLVFLMTTNIRITDTEDNLPPAIMSAHTAFQALKSAIEDALNVGATEAEIKAILSPKSLPIAQLREAVLRIITNAASEESRATNGRRIADTIGRTAEVTGATDRW